MQPWTVVIYHPVLSPHISHYSLHGFIQHEKHYFWAKLNLGFLKMKEQHSHSPGPLQNFFLFLLKVIAPALLHGKNFKRLFCKNNCRDGFVFSLFLLFFSFCSSICSFLLFSPILQPCLPVSFLSHSLSSMTTLGISAKRYHPSKSVSSFASWKSRFQRTTLHVAVFHRTDTSESPCDSIAGLGLPVQYLVSFLLWGSATPPLKHHFQVQLILQQQHLLYPWWFSCKGQYETVD